MASAKLKSDRLAMVLSGGGARGAYEAGVIHYLRTAIPSRMGGECTFQIQSGSSVGAINSSFMAAYAHDPKEQGRRIYKLWSSLDRDRVYRRKVDALSSFLGRTTKSISRNFFRLHPFDMSKRPVGAAHFKGFLDTSPLPPFLESVIPFKNIGQNIKQGIIDALTVTATNVSTGRMELFIQKRPNLKYTGEYAHSLTDISIDHIMASAAMPMIFPPVKIKNTFYTDGGLKLNTPMSPAIQLGAKRILLIGSHHYYRQGEKLMHTTPPGEQPSLGQLVGLIMNALFLERLNYDIEQLQRINRLIEWSEKVYGNNYVDEINKMLKEQGIQGDIAERGLNKIKLLHISPSRDISELFSECYRDADDNAKSFSAFEKMLLRVLDIDPYAGVDILSYLAFIPNYIRRLLELGYEDAAAHREELIEFLSMED